MVPACWPATLARVAALSLVLQGCASPGVSVTTGAGAVAGGVAAEGHGLHDAAALEEVVMALASGRALTLSVWRAGQLLSLVLTLPDRAP